MTDDRQPFARALDLANTESRGEASREEVAWLHAHPTLWFRALKYIVNDIKAQDFLAVQTIKEAGVLMAGRNPTQTYIDMKADVSAQRANRAGARRRFARRIEDVRNLLGGVDPVDVGTLIHGFDRIIELLDAGSYDQAREKAAGYRDALSRTQNAPAEDSTR